MPTMSASYSHGSIVLHMHLCCTSRLLILLRCCAAAVVMGAASAQVCLFDLDYGLPVQVRDTALGIEKEEIPESDVGKEFQLNEQIQRGQTESAFGAASGGRPNDMLMQLARTTPYYKVGHGDGVVVSFEQGPMTGRQPHACIGS